MKAQMISFTFLGLILLFFLGCEKQEDTPLHIAFSRASPEASYASYYSWIRSVDSTVICQDLYAMPLDSAMKLFKGCSGLLLTGGTDIHPGLYGKAYDTVRCWPIDDHLDLLEMTLIDSALAWGMPILGICRGHQMLNVALGGSLVVDIPIDFGIIVSHQCSDHQNCFHSVTIDTGSLLFEISGSATGEVNSNHHQASDQVAADLKAAAFTADGLIEAAGWKNPVGKSFLLGVQWHPERLGMDNPLSGPIAVRFLDECKKFRK